MEPSLGYMTDRSEAHLPGWGPGRFKHNLPVNHGMVLASYGFITGRGDFFRPTALM